jgi:hypothetical protein
LVATHPLPRRTKGRSLSIDDVRSTLIPCRTGDRGAITAGMKRHNGFDRAYVRTAALRVSTGKRTTQAGRQAASQLADAARGDRREILAASPSPILITACVVTARLTAESRRERRKAEAVHKCCCCSLACRANKSNASF